ncbi:FxsA family protein [Marinomonas hwangdonensis]|uniref:FxsA family protein n=1 Tax=Marinomonas hwangdonensis TaxID=1053647 RepID=A0A3M8Q289_9GAMM|nr:FxsA family protein [Marinomonas hwangdonensis]RNF49932.1 FxsA family protein [Marinomonas hwangdonensis]
MRFALLLFILVPVVEMLVLIQVGGQIGGLTTVALVFLTAVVGIALIRKQGLQTSLKAQEKMRRGEIPASEVAEGAMLIFAGVCLLIPGFVTDVLGGVMLIPPLRKLLAAGLIVKFISSFAVKGAQQSGHYHFTSRYDKSSKDKGDIIEGEYVNEENDLIDKK